MNLKIIPIHRKLKTNPKYSLTTIWKKRGKEKVLVICSARTIYSVHCLTSTSFARQTSVHLEQCLKRLPYQNGKITDQDRERFAKNFLPVLWQYDFSYDMMTSGWHCMWIKHSDSHNIGKLIQGQSISHDSSTLLDPYKRKIKTNHR